MTNPNVFPAREGVEGFRLSTPALPAEPVLPEGSDPGYQPADGIMSYPSIPAEPVLPDGSDPGYQPADGIMSYPSMPAEYDPATPLEMGERIEAPLAGSEPADYDAATPMEMGERIEAPLAGVEPSQFDPATPALPAEQPRLAMRSVGPEDEDEPRAYESEPRGAYKSTQPGAYKSTPAPGSGDTDSDPGDTDSYSGSDGGSVYRAPIRVDTEVMAAGIPVVRSLASDLGDTGRDLDSGVSSLQLGGDDQYGKAYRAAGVPMTKQLLSGISGAAGTLEYAGDNTAYSADGFTDTEAGAADIARGVSS